MATGYRYVYQVLKKRLWRQNPFLQLVFIHKRALSTCALCAVTGRGCEATLTGCCENLMQLTFWCVLCVAHLEIPSSIKQFQNPSQRCSFFWRREAFMVKKSGYPLPGRLPSGKLLVLFFANGEMAIGSMADMSKYFLGFKSTNLAHELGHHLVDVFCRVISAFLRRYSHQLVKSRAHVLYDSFIQVLFHLVTAIFRRFPNIGDPQSPWDSIPSHGHPWLGWFGGSPMSLETSSCFGCLGDWPSVAVSDLARHCSGPDERGQGHSGAAGVTKRDEN